MTQAHIIDQEINYPFFIHMIYFEVFLIISVVISCYALYALRKWQIKRLRRNTALMIHAFKNPNTLQDYYFNQDLLYTFINSCDEYKKLNEKNHCDRIKEWAKKMILPKIKTSSESVFWYQRYLAAKAMQSDLSPMNEEVLEKLLRDPRPCVVVEAVSAMQRAPSEKLVNTLIDKIARYQRKNHEFYFDLFATMPDSIRDLVEKRLNYERRYAERALCYDLLRFFPKPRVYPTAYEDVKSSNIELAIAAIKHICRAEQPKIEIMESWLADSRQDLMLIVFAKIAEHRWTCFKPQVNKYLNHNDIKLKHAADACLKLLEE